MGARADVAPTSPPVHLRYTGRKKGSVPPQGEPPSHSPPNASLRAWTHHLLPLLKTAPRTSGGARQDTPAPKAWTAPSATWDSGLPLGYRCRGPHRAGGRSPGRRPTQPRGTRPETNLTLRVGAAKLPQVVRSCPPSTRGEAGAQKQAWPGHTAP